MVDAQTIVEFPSDTGAMPTRVNGMGGAFVGVAEGADGQRTNPAAFGTRYQQTRSDFFDYDFTFYYQSVPGSEGSIDLSGLPGRIGEASVIGLGVDAKLSIFGFGIHAYNRLYRLEAPKDLAEGQEQPTWSSGLLMLGFAWALPWISTTIGIAPTVASYSVQDADSNVLADITGGGVKIGFITKPQGLPFRIGGAYRPAILADVENEAVDSEATALRPDALAVPGELRLGGSYMFGDRTYNPARNYGVPRHFGSPGPEHIERKYFLVAADIVLTQPTENGLGMQSFLERAPLRSGENWSFGANLGIEWEFWANWMRVRSGFYWEPSRIESIRGRHHGTAGFDFRIPASELASFIPDLKLVGVADVARDYRNIGFGFGLWY
jgi:hypothetical protein